MIDGQGRIVFDSSDDANDASAEGVKPRRREDATADEEDEEGDGLVGRPPASSSPGAAAVGE